LKGDKDLNVILIKRCSIIISLMKQGGHRPLFFFKNTIIKVENELAQK